MRNNRRLENWSSYRPHFMNQSGFADNPRNVVFVAEGPRMSTCSVENEIDNLA